MAKRIEGDFLKQDDPIFTGGPILYSALRPPSAARSSHSGTTSDSPARKGAAQAPSTNNLSAVRIGRLIHRARRDLGLSARRVESLLTERYSKDGSISQANLYRLESGQIAKPVLVDLLKLSRLYRLSVSRIIEAAGFGGTEEAQIEDPELSETKSRMLAVADALATQGSDEQAGYALTMLQMMLDHFGLGRQ